MATNERRTAAAVSRTPEAEGALKELFISEMKDIYWAELHLVKALPKMVDSATAIELKHVINNHLTQTKNHVIRLERAFESIGEKAEAVKCEAMAGLLKEAEQLVDETKKGTEVRDVAIISAAQKVEHYEIATYGTLKSIAATLGFTDAETIFSATLEEEKGADAMLSLVAENCINEGALLE